MTTYTTQLLVIGGGASGMAAATAALEKGVETTIVETNPRLGGNGLFPRGVFAVGSVLQRRKLVLPDVDAVFRECMEDAHWKIDGRIIRALLDKSGDTISWLMDKGVQFVDVVHHIPNQTPEVFHICDEHENAGAAVMKALEKYCREHGARILLKTRATDLLQNEDGSVRGALCETKDTEVIRIEAQKVIIGTGGFAGNKEMIAKYYPDFDFERVPMGGGMRHHGDGIRMAQAAGAVTDKNFTMEIAAPKIQGYAPLNLLLGKPYNVWLNTFGKRFADEGIVYHFAHAANAVQRQPDTRVYVVFDQGLIEKTLRDGRDMIELIHIPLDAEEKLDETIEKAIAGGVLCRSDTFEGLSDFIGCAPEDVAASLQEYNQYCAAGRDAVYAKDAQNLIALTQGPYYAVKAGCDMLITHGGIRVDEAFHALRSDQRPLGNLFITGVDFGGADADVYNVNMSGHGFGFALNSGRIAGENAASELI